MPPAQRRENVGIAAHRDTFFRPLLEIRNLRCLEANLLFDPFSNYSRDWVHSAWAHSDTFGYKAFLEVHSYEPLRPTLVDSKEGCWVRFANLASTGDLMVWTRPGE